MTPVLESPPDLQPPDAGVIEEARARQRRHRGFGAAAVTVLAMGAVVLSIGGGGSGGSHPGARLSSPAGPLAKTSSTSSNSCLSRGVDLKGPPEKSLLSILGVLRRPAEPGDSIGRSLSGTGLTRDVFIDYERRTQVIAGSPYYLFPAIVGGCGVERPREGISVMETNLDLGGGAIGGDGGDGGGAYTPAEIESGQTVSTGAPGTKTTTTLTMIVPDGVARVRIHLPAGRANGFRPEISPAVTISGKPRGNELVLTLPRSHLPESMRGVSMAWLAGDGRIVRAFDRL